MSKLIEDRMPQAAIYEQLAEECTELGKAALKKARILRGENPTPVTVEEADASVKEEYTDVVQCAMMLDIQTDWAQMEAKEKRWNKRLDERDARNDNQEEDPLPNLAFMSYGENEATGSITLRFVSENPDDKYILKLYPQGQCTESSHCYYIATFNKNGKKQNVSVKYMDELLCMIINNNPSARISDVLRKILIIDGDAETETTAKAFAKFANFKPVGWWTSGSMFAAIKFVDMVEKQPFELRLFRTYIPDLDKYGWAGVLKTEGIRCPITIEEANYLKDMANSISPYGLREMRIDVVYGRDEEPPCWMI